MTNFDLSSLPWAPPDPPPPPVDPAVARQQRIFDDTTVESAITRFIADKQDVLFNQPDAFYRTQGVDAIHAAPVTMKRLLDLKDTALDRTDNDYQRRRLGDALDAHMVLVRGGIARHVADQSLEWQRRTALDRIDLLAKEAAFHQAHGDDLIGAMGAAAANAARAHARVGDVPPAPETEDQAAAAARNRILSATIQARVDAGNTANAASLYEKVRAQLDRSQARSLGDQIQTARRRDAARAYSLQLLPGPMTSHEEADGWHFDATAQNARDHADDPEQQAIVQHLLDVNRAQSKRAIDERQATLDRTVEDWIAAPGLDGKPQTNLPPSSVWMQLDDARKTALLEGLRQNRRPSVVATASSPPISTAGIAAPPTPYGGLDTVLRPLTSLAGRLAPLAAEAPVIGVAAGAATLLTPTNFQGGTIDLGDGLQARWAPGQRSATIERRVDNGLFGTGLGAKWETLPVPATYEPDEHGRQTLRVDDAALKRALAANAHGTSAEVEALPVARPMAIKMVIGASVHGRVTFEKATDEEAKQYCPNYPMFQKIAVEAAKTANEIGLPKGPARGIFIHKLADNEVQKAAKLTELLELHGIKKLHPEIALKEGVLHSRWRAKGVSFPDVTEIYDRQTVCVYDFKSGTGRASEADMRRYLREAGLYASKAYGEGYTHIYFVPVHVTNAYQP
jgi:hypothetical protein